MRKLPTESLKLRTQFKPTNIMTMNNPFELIETRLIRIEALLTDLKQNPTIAPEPPEQLLTIQEAAEFLNLAVPTVYSNVSKSKLPFMKRGNRLYFSRAELMAYIKGGRQKTNAELDAEVDEYLANDRRAL